MMHNLFLLTPGVRIYIIILTIVAIGFQTAHLLLLYFHKEHKVDFAIKIGDILITIHMLYIASLLSSIHLGDQNASEFLGYIYLIDLIPFLACLIVGIKYKKPDYILCSLAIVSLPISFGTNIYSILFIISAFLLFFRSIIIFYMELSKAKKSITMLSIKEVVDRLTDGVIYADGVDNIFISNPIMVRLIELMNLSINMNASFLWEEISRVRDEDNIVTKNIEDSVLIRLTDHGSWLFSKTKLLLNNHEYTQIIAIDVTEEDYLTQELEISNNKLLLIKDNLTDNLMQIEDIEKENILINSKARFHELITQRLSILNRIIENDGCTVDTKELKALLSNLVESVGNEPENNKRKLLNALAEAYTLVGIKMHFSGELPSDENALTVFISNIRECTNNAIRHAYSQNIFVEFNEASDYYSMTIKNDGLLPLENFSKGNGITEMENRTKKLHGYMKITTDPDFKVKTIIPKKDYPKK